MAKKVAVLIRDKERQFEGLRSSLGLLLEDHIVSMFMLNHKIDISEEFVDNMMFIDEMGGARYSNVDENVKEHGFQSVTLDDIVDKLRENEIIIPF